MRRRSLTITIFCLGELIFTIQLLFQSEIVQSEVAEWNKRSDKKDFKDIMTVFKCNSSSSINSTCEDLCCCENSTLSVLTSSYDKFKESKRNADLLKPLLYPLIAVAALNVVAAILFNSGAFELTKLLLKCTCCSAKCIGRLSSMIWTACWLVEAAIGVFAVVMTATAIPKLGPDDLSFFKLCREAGMLVLDEDKNTTGCFRKLQVCPTTQEHSLIVLVTLSVFIIVCAILKIGYRFFQLEDDNERFPCVNCCRCKHKRTKETRDPDTETIASDHEIADAVPEQSSNAPSSGDTRATGK